MSLASNLSNRGGVSELPLPAFPVFQRVKAQPSLPRANRTMWNAISNLGDAALTLPVAISCTIWLELSSREVANRWMLLLAAGMALVGVTKILHAGFGVAIPSIRFRIISGHTTLSTAVWAVTLALLFRSAGGDARVGAGAGLAIGMLTAAARVFDHAHTVSEVVTGWLLGGAIAALVVRALARSRTRLVRPAVAAAGLLMITTVAYGRHAPIQSMIDRYSPDVCARAIGGVASFF